MNVEYKAANYILYGTVYEDEEIDSVKDSIYITGYSGSGGRVVIPDMIESSGNMYSVTGIGKKAFTGEKSLREISMPGSIRRLEDWAFAQCCNLNKVVFRVEEVVADRAKASDFMNQLLLGSGVFDECSGMECICIGSDEENALSVMLGAIVNRMDAEYLLRSKEVGSDAWFQLWDQTLMSFLGRPDDDGYTDMVLCGEEDLSINEESYIRDMRKRKCVLCILRLAYSDKLSGDMRQSFTDYLVKHTKGAATEEAWEVMLSEFGDHVDYYRLFAELGCINKENIDDIIMDMGNQHAEAKAFVIEYKQEHFGEGNFFDQFTL